MRDYDQLFIRGLDYVKAAVINWDERRSKLTKEYVSTGDFALIRGRLDRYLMLILALETRIDEVFFKYREYVAEQKEIGKMLEGMGMEVEK